uniref:Uncharacterized protein n=1 Tax=Anopheles atroparvus TaxID=41427 RepID=A0A182J9Z9_ANOAO
MAAAAVAEARRKRKRRAAGHAAGVACQGGRGKGGGTRASTWTPKDEQPSRSETGGRHRAPWLAAEVVVVEVVVVVFLVVVVVVVVVMVVFPATHTSSSTYLYERRGLRVRSSRRDLPEDISTRMRVPQHRLEGKAKPGGFRATQTFLSGPYLPNALSISCFDADEPRKVSEKRARVVQHKKVAGGMCGHRVEIQSNSSGWK